MSELCYKIKCVIRRVMYRFLPTPKKEDTGLRGTFEGKLYVDKKVFYRRKDVKESIMNIKKWYYKNYT